VHNPLIIKDIPVEIMMMIFKELLHNNDEGSALCLGLACSKFYPIFKTVFPHPIFLGRLCFCDPQRHVKWYIGHQIQDFFSPDYRLSANLGGLCKLRGGPARSFFLKRSVYGDEYGVKERDLKNRYQDYEKMYHRLSNPHSMGDDWLMEIRNKFGEQGSPMWPEYVKKCYKTTHVYEKTRDGNRKADLSMMIWSGCILLYCGILVLAE
jgi:hypothetical protein